MKFARESSVETNAIRGYDASSLRVGDTLITRSCLIDAKHLLQDWPVNDVAMLHVDHFEPAFAWQPEIIILGTGARQTFPSPTLSAAIRSRGVGFEVMDMGAACRTYNVLLGEGRRVAVGLLLVGNGGEGPQRR
jgi:uncharacterized protein